MACIVLIATVAIWYLNSSHTWAAISLPIEGLYLGVIQLLSAAVGGLIGVLSAAHGANKQHSHQIARDRDSRAQRTRALAIALSAEIAAIAHRVQFADYVGSYEDAAKNGGPSGAAAPKGNFFTIYDANTSEIGNLTLELVQAVVTFYVNAKGLRESMALIEQAENTNDPGNFPSREWYTAIANELREMLETAGNLVERLKSHAARA